MNSESVSVEFRFSVERCLRIAGGGTRSLVFTTHVRVQLECA
jgi:hypothetical protein